MDSPKYMMDILIAINPKVKGRPLKNPIPQPDGAKYASDLDGIEYYLWEDTITLLR